MTKRYYKVTAKKVSKEQEKMSERDKGAKTLEKVKKKG